MYILQYALVLLWLEAKSFGQLDADILFDSFLAERRFNSRRLVSDRRYDQSLLLCAFPSARTVMIM
jgi:hypothetical protein